MSRRSELAACVGWTLLGLALLVAGGWLNLLFIRWAVK